MRTEVRHIREAGGRRSMRQDRRSGRIPGQVRCATAVLFVALAAESVSRSAEWPLSADELASLWEGQRSDITTAVVRFRHCNGALENPQNTPERVSQLLAKYDLVEQPDLLHSFLLALAGQPFSVADPVRETVLTVSGRRRRVSDEYCDFVTDGTIEAEYAPSNRQISLHPVGKSRVHHYGLDDLRWTPPHGISAARWRLLRVEDQVAVFNVPPAPEGIQFAVVTSIDSASGIVTHSITWHPDGSPAVEMYQAGLELNSAGIVFPRLRIDLTYAAGIVRTARVIVVQSARFNEPVDESAFLLPVPKGTRIIDYRTAEKAAYLANTAAEPDALALPVRNLDAPPRTTPALSATSPPKSRWIVLVAVHLAVLLCLGAMKLRRRRSAETRRP